MNNSKRPGRDLDAQVALNVMGWHHLWHGKMYGNLLGYQADYSLVPDTGPTDPKNCPYAKDIPRYSTDIASAWAILEHFRAEWEVQLQNHDRETAEPLKGWTVRIGSYEAQARTAPLAICLAALHAVEV